MFDSENPSRTVQAARLSRRTVLKSSAALGGAAVMANLGFGMSGPTGALAQDGNYAVFASIVDIPNIDPAVGHDGAIAVSQKSLYDTLYRHLGSSMELVPWLATTHTQSDDGLTYTFTLDPNAKFQDGSPVTADAVVYSFQRLLDVGQGVAYMFEGVVARDACVAVDPATVTFTLTKPFAPFLHTIAWLFILNPAVVAENEVDGDLGQAWLVSNSAGSGPFKIGRWEPGNLYQFDADPNYWKGWEGAHLDGYIHQVSAESSTKRLALENGEIHFADWLSTQDKILLQSKPEIVVPMDPGLSTYTIKMNTQVGPTADVNVRRALSYAFDYDAMIELLSGFGSLLVSPLSPAISGAVTTPTYTHDIEKAKAALALSEEYKDGFDIEFVYVSGIEEERQTGQILADSVKELNINVTITGMEWANAVALFADPETSPSLFPIYSGTDYPDPDNFLYQTYHSSSAGTWMGADQYSNPDVDSLLDEARSTVDEAARVELYGQVQQLVIDDAVEIFVYTALAGTPHLATIQGYEICPVMGSSPWWYSISLA
jgi:peptide/nickel transport system substrate-binding protein